jgi:hypothetical protein
MAAVQVATVNGCAIFQKILPAVGSVPALPLDSFSAPSANVFGAQSLASAVEAVEAAAAAFAAGVAALAAKRAEEAAANEAAVVAWAKTQPVTVWAVYGVSVDLAWQVDMYLASARKGA